MKYVVMVSHGEFAPGLHSAVKMMTGDREDVLSTSLKDGMTAPVGFAHDIGKLFFQCGQVRCGTAGERPNFVFFHGRTSELIHK